MDVEDNWLLILIRQQDLTQKTADGRYDSDRQENRIEREEKRGPRKMTKTPRGDRGRAYIKT